MTFEIRRARPADVDEIAAAHVDSIRSIGPRYYGPDIVSDWVARLEGGFYVVDPIDFKSVGAYIRSS